MDNIQLTRSELALLRLWLAAKQSEGEPSTQLGVDLRVLYGKINMMYNDACNLERQTLTA